MTSTHVQSDIGTQDNGCAVVALLSASAQVAIANLQKQLRARLGEVLWTMPAMSLHVTLCEIIQPKPYSIDKQVLYEENHEAYEAVLAEILRNYRPIKVHFNTIEATQQAIIVRGEDNGVLNSIRAELVEHLPFPAETKQPPNIIHSSIARYIKDCDLEIVKAATQQCSIDFVETITEFQFLYPTWPHLFHYEVVRRYQLERQP